MKKSGHGTYDTKVDTTNKIVATKWYDNKFVHVVSNYKGIHPLDEVERWLFMYNFSYCQCVVNSWLLY